VMVFPLIPKTKEKEGEKKLKMRKGFASWFFGGLVS
jgi:hypothetical protein